MTNFILFRQSTYIFIQILNDMSIGLLYLYFFIFVPIVLYFCEYIRMRKFVFAFVRDCLAVFTIACIENNCVKSSIRPRHVGCISIQPSKIIAQLLVFYFYRHIYMSDMLYDWKTL